MSLTTTDRVDAALTRDGWTILAIHHFESWDPVDQRSEELHKKLLTYERFIQSPRYLLAFSERPVAIELNCVEPPPEQIRKLCRRWGIRILAP